MDLESFLTRWKDAPSSERANSQRFLLELCEVIGVEKPGTGNVGAYAFERTVKRVFPDGSKRSDGRIDLYKKGCFVLESKQTIEKVRASKPKFDEAMLLARQQAEDYAKALDEWPPFLIVVDVGFAIELYADFSGSGKRYLPFKDAATHRLTLASLRDEKVRALLHDVWTQPRSLDPSLHQQEVTKRVAENLARLARSLEEDGHHPEAVASFLMRCIFTMFAEDVRLIPEQSFTNKLRHWKEQPAKFAAGVQALWQEMATGRPTSFSFDATGARVLCFNGGLFSHTDAFTLKATEIGWLLAAAEQDWKNVEPAIFGTLLERALNPTERHKLGAHFTPRAYVERLVFPTVIEPLREDWDRVQLAVSGWLSKDKPKKAKEELLAFHRQLCATKVLDPACGTGNFLYVALEHMKRLEGEVLERLALLEGTRRLDLFGKDHETVDPHQFLGIEVNERAAVIAELVLWIGFLQWQFRNAVRQGDEWPEPVLRKFGNIEQRDAVLAWDRIELVSDPTTGKPLTRWDGTSTKKHPVTGEQVPDESKTVTIQRYINPRKAEWPKADFVVGNPPFLGASQMRSALGDGYVAALRETWSSVPESCDLVMYWWSHSASLLSEKMLRRFGLITTNSLHQIFNRRVLDTALANGVRLRLAVRDQPWSDASQSAAVRVALTVARVGEDIGQLFNDDIGPAVLGAINSQLRIGVNVAGTKPLLANAGLSSMGVKLHGQGFVVSPDQRNLWLEMLPLSKAYVRPYITSKSLTQSAKERFAIDLLGIDVLDVQQTMPAIYQHLLVSVKPERDENNRQQYRDLWWLFGEPRKEIRPALAELRRMVVTPRTAKHRTFLFLDAMSIAESEVVCVAIADAYSLGILSSSPHRTFALAAGGRLGVGNDPRYNNTVCFDPFPFPDASDAQKQTIRALGEALDAHRKKQQAQHPDLTITGMYNVLEKLRSGEQLSQKEHVIHEQGLVSVLKQLHDDLDAAVFAAYGWPKELSDEQILEKLVALNHERAAEEKRGLIRWLRPEYQVPLLQKQPGKKAEQAELVEEDDDDAPKAVKKKVAALKREPWPDGLPARVGAIDQALQQSGSATAASLAKLFGRKSNEEIDEILEVLREWGRVEQVDHEVFVAVG